MHRSGFEPAIPICERPKTVRALDRAVIGTGNSSIYYVIFVLHIFILGNSYTHTHTHTRWEFIY
jgi:hypothetical protein